MADKSKINEYKKVLSETAFSSFNEKYDRMVEFLNGEKEFSEQEIKTIINDIDYFAKSYKGTRDDHDLIMTALNEIYSYYIEKKDDESSGNGNEDNQDESDDKGNSPCETP